MIHTERYNPEFKSIWNRLIEESINGNFMFKRSFMDYHQDRFEDFSYLIWRGSKLVAVFVAAMPRKRLDNSTLIAHPGLTYGGLVYGTGLKYARLEQLYELLLDTLVKEGIEIIIIKPVPNVFYRNYSDVDKFILNKLGFILAKRELNSVIISSESIQLNENKKRTIQKSIKNKVYVTTSTDYKNYWDILRRTLKQQHNVEPVHTLNEINESVSSNPTHIKLYVAIKDGEVVAGVVTFSDARQGYVHAQYIAGSEVGKAIGAVDAVLLHVIEEAMAKQQRFSFGISSVNGKVNYGLLRHKEGFGATTEVMDTYEKYI